MSTLDQRDDDITRALAADRLGVPAVIFFVLSAAAPLTVVAGVITTGFAVTGLIAMPAAFVVVALVLALFSVGYVAMGRYLPHAGAFYAYISHGINRAAGVGAAWVALLAYNALQVGLYGAIGVAAGPLVKQYAGFDLAWWVYALVAWALVTTLGLLRVDLNGTVLAVLLCAEILVITVYDVGYLGHRTDLALSTFSPGQLFKDGAGALLALAVLGFVGFESAVVFSEESRNPRRTVPVATYASIVIIGGLYALSSWALVSTVGTGKVVAAARDQGPGLVFGTAAQQLGSSMGDVGSALFVTSLLAAMISFHNTTARYVFALGRERVLPAVFGTTSSTGAPRPGSIAQSVIGLVVILVYAIAGLDPLVQLFYTLGTSGGFGVLFLIWWTSVAVVVFFARRRHGESVWRARVAPALAVAAVTGVLLLATANFATLLGVDESSPLRWGVPIAFVLVAALGTLYGAYLRSSRPAVYASIGLGGKSTSQGFAQPRASVDDVDPVRGSRR